MPLVAEPILALRERAARRGARPRGAGRHGRLLAGPGGDLRNRRRRAGHPGHHRPRPGAPPRSPTGWTGPCWWCPASPAARSRPTRTGGPTSRPSPRPASTRSSGIVVVTDPGSPLQQVAEEAGYRKVFLADPNVGGRYSALTAFGLVPVRPGRGRHRGPAGRRGGGRRRARAGRARQPRAAARRAARAGPQRRLGQGGARRFRLRHQRIRRLGRAADRRVDRQGRARPAAGGGRGPAAPGFAGAGPDAILVASRRLRADDAAGLRLGLPSTAGPLGGQMLLWEYATAVAGRLIGINPFDQPNVEEAKKQARSLLDATDALAGARAGADRRRRSQVFGYGIDLSGIGIVDEALQALFAAAPAFGYVAIQAYLDRLADDQAGRAAAGWWPAGPACRPPSAGGRGSCTPPASTTRAATRTGCSCRSPARSPRTWRSRAGRTPSAPCSGPGGRRRDRAGGQGPSGAAPASDRPGCRYRTVVAHR